MGSWPRSVSLVRMKTIFVLIPFLSVALAQNGGFFSGITGAFNDFFNGGSSSSNTRPFQQQPARPRPQQFQQQQFQQQQQQQQQFNQPPRQQFAPRPSPLSPGIPTPVPVPAYSQPSCLCPSFPDQPGRWRNLTLRSCSSKPFLERSPRQHREGLCCHLENWLHNLPTARSPCLLQLHEHGAGLPRLSCQARSVQSSDSSGCSKILLDRRNC